MKEETISIDITVPQINLIFIGADARPYRGYMLAPHHIQEAIEQYIKNNFGKGVKVKSK